MKTKAFTLIEMILILCMMGVIVMLCAGLTGTQIKKLQYKTIKEQILSEYQIYYSRNLTSGMYGHTEYDTLQISFQKGSNAMVFQYTMVDDNPFQPETMFGDFVWERITHDHAWVAAFPGVTLSMTPYEIPCTITLSDGEERDRVILVANIKEEERVCFEIIAKTCRMRQQKDDECQELIDLIIHDGV